MGLIVLDTADGALLRALKASDESVLLLGLECVHEEREQLQSGRESKF